MLRGSKDISLHIVTSHLHFIFLAFLDYTLFSANYFDISFATLFSLILYLLITLLNSLIILLISYFDDDQTIYAD